MYNPDIDTCESCKHRVNGSDSHMVCRIRDYVCRVAKNDSCRCYKSKNRITKIIKSKKKKRYIIGTGYPWYQDAHEDIYKGKLQTSHGLGCIKLYKEHNIPNNLIDPIIMLNPKGTHNGKKYRLILEEV